MNICQPPVGAACPYRQACVVDSQQVQDGRVNVVHQCWSAFVRRAETESIGWAVRDATLDTATGQPRCEAVGVMIAAFASLTAGHATKFRGPHHNGFVK